MDKKKKRILHDLKRIAQSMELLKSELDRLYEDIDNGAENGEKT